MFESGITGTSNKVKTVDPIHSLIQVEGIPPKLVWDVVKLLCFGGHVGVV